MTRSQIRLVGLLFLVLMIALTVFRFDWFLVNALTVWIFKGLVAGSVVGLAIWLGRVGRVSTWVFLGIFGLAEAGVWGYTAYLMRGRRNQAPGFAFFRSLTEDWHKNLLQYDPALSQYDPGLFYTLKPGLRGGQFSNQEFSVRIDANRAGLRDDDAALQHPSMVVLGDSFALGWGVADSASFPSQLERMLGQKTLNAGVSSFGTARETELLRRLQLDSCRLLVVQYCTNDDHENKVYRQGHFRLQTSGREIYDQYVCSNSVMGHYFPFKYLYSALRTGLVRWQQRTAPAPAPVVASTPVAEETLTPTTTFFQIIARVQAVYHGPVLVTYLDSYATTPEVMRLFGQHLQAHPLPNVYLADVSDVLTPDDYFVFDNHIRAKGHRKVAERLYEVIQALPAAGK